MSQYAYNYKCSVFSFSNPDMGTWEIVGWILCFHIFNYDLSTFCFVLFLHFNLDFKIKVRKILKNRKLSELHFWGEVDIRMKSDGYFHSDNFQMNFGFVVTIFFQPCNKNCSFSSYPSTWHSLINMYDRSIQLL